MPPIRLLCFHHLACPSTTPTTLRRALASRCGVRNTDKEPATYNMTHRRAITMYTLGKDSIYVQAFPNEVVHAAASLNLSETSITLRGGEIKTIEVSAIPPEDLDGKRLALWSGYITINGTDGASLSLPYQRLTGSLLEHVVPGSNDTWISESTDFGPSPSPVPSNKKFTLPKPGNAVPEDLLPQLSVNLALGSPMIRAEIVPLSPDPKNETLTHESGASRPLASLTAFLRCGNPVGITAFLGMGFLTLAAMLRRGHTSLLFMLLASMAMRRRRKNGM
ncbi:hypothetical protein E4U52_006999 [Claviceps spartinae]|nr:hypothetical protein E4U52_006999 [Claviceps spartinae]